MATKWYLYRQLNLCCIAQAKAQQEAWSRCCHWHIPCYLKPHLAPSQPPSPVTPAQGISRQPQSPSCQSISTSRQSQQPQQLLPADTVRNQVAVPQVIHLDVSTCAVLPDLALEGEGTSWQPDRGLWEVDFGKLWMPVSILLLSTVNNQYRPCMHASLMALLRLYLLADMWCIIVLLC